MTIIEMEDEIQDTLKQVLPRVYITCDILPQADVDFEDMCKTAGEHDSAIYIAWGGEAPGGENVNSQIYYPRQLFYIFIMSKRRRQRGILEYYDTVKETLHKMQYGLISGEATPAQDKTSGIYMAVLTVAKMEFFPN